jgi:hypothetical protein
MSFVRSSFFAFAALVLLLPVSPPLAGQIVQPIPGPEVEALSQALLELAESPRDVGALNRAGEAALAVDDVDAALGFFGRALELEPRSGAANLGLARTLVEQHRPTDALEHFELAATYGADLARGAAEHGLALDLIGRHREAQAKYRLAIAQDDDPALVRRLAISLAVAGDSANFEQTLQPLLQRGDRSAFRTRAFGLAILGNVAEARALVDALGPAELARRTYPYLDLLGAMDRRQQVAAVNLGVFEGGREEVERDRPDLRTAFADFASLPPAPAAGPIRGNAAQIAQPPAPVSSATDAPRIWVQLATGRDREALRFDWRRILRASEGLLAGLEPHLATQGPSTRLLAGPFETLSEADALVLALKENGIDSFRYRSPEGQKIDPLPR